jgi:hypothetical protein
MRRDSSEQRHLPGKRAPLSGPQPVGKPDSPVEAEARIVGRREDHAESFGQRVNIDEKFSLLLHQAKYLPHK